jgi:hypothetical protein
MPIVDGELQFGGLERLPQFMRGIQEAPKDVLEVLVGKLSHQFG